MTINQNKTIQAGDGTGRSRSRNEVKETKRIGLLLLLRWHDIVVYEKKAANSKENKTSVDEEEYDDIVIISAWFLIENKTFAYLNTLKRKTQQLVWRWVTTRARLLFDRNSSIIGEEKVEQEYEHEHKNYERFLVQF